jgi:hypothetical protein
VTGETTSDAECQRIINLFRELGSDGLAVIFERYLQKVRQ